MTRLSVPGSPREVDAVPPHVAMFSAAEVAEERRRSLRRYLICLGVLGILTAANVSMISHTLFRQTTPCSASPIGGGQR